MRKLISVLALLGAFAFGGSALAADVNYPSNAEGTLSWDASGFTLTRNASIYKTASAVVVTTQTTVWTPAAGKSFRLMGYCLSEGVATGAVTLKDGATVIFIIPQNTVGVPSCVSLGNGILSAAANNVLSATGASTETITGTFWGTEE